MRRRGSLGLQDRKIGKKKPRSKEGSAFTTCPVCNRTIALATSAIHIEECLAKDALEVPASRKIAQNLTATSSPCEDLGQLQSHQILSGQFLWEDFISAKEEEEILNFLDHDGAQSWTFNNFNGPAYRQRWGYEVNLYKRTISEPRYPFPQVLKRLFERMRKGGGDVLKNFKPDEANAIDYRKSQGHELEPHFDDRQLNGDILCNLCLKGDCVMTYVYGKSKNSRPKLQQHQSVDKVNVILPRRSLQVQTGSVRYDWKHSISNENLLSERRVSITFRECRFKQGK